MLISHIVQMKNMSFSEVGFKGTHLVGSGDSMAPKRLEHAWSQYFDILSLSLLL